MIRNGLFQRLGLGRRPASNGAYHEAESDEEVGLTGGEGWLTAVGVRKSYKRRLVVRETT